MAINDYCTATEIKAAAPGTTWSSTYDTLLGTLATRASRVVDRDTGRQPGYFYVSTDVTRYFDGSGTRELKIGELAAAPTSVSVAETGIVDNAAGTGGTYTVWTTDDYVLWPYTSDSGYEPYTRLIIASETETTKAVWYAFKRAVKIVGKFGWAAAIPDDIKQATIIEAMRMYKRGMQGYEDAGAIQELGQLRMVKAKDPEYMSLIAPYMRITA